MADGKVVIETDLDSSGIKTGLSKLSSIAQSGIKGTLTAIASAGTALAGLGGAAIKIGADFEEGMSEVQAISRASASDMELLKEKAKEMGAETKFSATESAAAFKYMAQAGWNTEDMLNGISGVMSLAAASGEDLALTADIVTDSLTAFGLEAKDAAHFSDVLAMTANATNTDVANLGYTFKYVAPVAGALGYSIEDMSVAIGLMANSGIKAETAGTALRATLTNLAKPTQQMTGYMEELGISLTDAQGNVKPFNEVMIDLREGFEGLTEAQKAEYAAGIAGKEAMSGLLAIVNASDEDFAALTEQINNCNGAAEEAAKIMQDNLKGSVEQLGGALETLGIEFYDSVNTPIRTIVDSATSMVEQLTKAFKDGGLSGLVSELGTAFAEVATQAANSAPKMIDAATSMITSFLDGISHNSGQIAEAAVKIGESLINGIAQIIPKVAEVGVEIISSLASNLLGSDVGKSVGELGKTIIDSFKTIASAVSGALNSLKPIFSTFISTVSKIAKTVIPPLTKVVEACIKAIKPLTPLLTAAAGGFAALKIVQTATSWVKSFTTSETLLAAKTTITNALLWAKIAATEVLTGKITLAQAAQQLWNIAMSSNPIGAVVAAIGVFVGVLSGLAVALSGTNSEYQNAIGSLNNLKEAHEEVRAEQQKALEADFKEIDQINVLKTELDKLVDSNGKIKDGYLDRATAIAGELAEATGLEIEIIDGQIQKYGELGESIDAVITKKQMAALSESLQEISDNAESQLDEARAHLETVTKAYNDAQTVYDKTKEQAERTGDFSKLGSLERDLENKKAEMENQLAFIDSLREDMAMGTEAFAISASGDVKAMSDFMTRVSVKVDETGKAIIQSETSTYAERERLAQDYRDMAERTTDQYLKDIYIKQAEELERQNAQMDSSLGIQIALIDSKGEQFSLSYAALMDKAAEGITNGGVGVDLAMQENMSSIVAAITDSQLPVEEQMKLIADLQTEVLKNATPEAAESQKRLLGSIIQAIADKNPEVKASMQSLVDAGLIVIDNKENMNSAYTKGSNVSQKAKEGLESEDTSSAGNDFVAGFVNAMTSNENLTKVLGGGAVLGAMAGAGLRSSKGIDSHSPSKKARKSGNDFVDGFILSIRDRAAEAAEESAKLGEGVVSGLTRELDQLPEQEIKLVGLLEKIKGLDATALMDQARAAVYSNQMAVAGAAARSNYTMNTGIAQNSYSGGDRQTVINFNQPVESPDATARAINRIFTFGLAGDKG